MLQASKQSNLKAVQKKFSLSKFGEVARIPIGSEKKDTSEES